MCDPRLNARQSVDLVVPGRRAPPPVHLSESGSTAMTALDLTARLARPPRLSAAVLRGGNSSPRSATSTGCSGSRRSPSRWPRGRSLVAVEEGIVELDQPVGQPGCTLRHLLAHAGGYPFDGDDPIARPEATRMYSNTGFELAARRRRDARPPSPSPTTSHEAVFVPLGMHVERAARLGRRMACDRTWPTRAGSSPR